MPIFPGFIGGSNTSQSLVADAERTVNLFVEPMQSRGAPYPAALFPTPGFETWATVADVGSRCYFVANGRFFAVIGGGFYEFSSTGVATRYGTVTQDSNPAQMAYNGLVGGQLGICSGGSVYTFALATNAFAGPHFGGATVTMLSFADGYGLGFDLTSGKVYLSSLNDFSVWSLGTFFQRSKFPDPWQTMFVDPNGLIWLIGTETFEVWYNTGAGTQPWAPLSGLFGRFGTVAPFAFGVSWAGMFWIARSAEGGAVAVRTKGSVPEAVSTYAVNGALAQYLRSNQIRDAELLLYQDQGHSFANFSFPSANATWSLDAEAQGWGERGAWNSAAGRYDVWAPRVHAECFGKHLVGDRSTGTVYVMDTTLTTEIDGTGIRRLRRTPGLIDEHKRVPIDQLELLMDVGFGTATGAGSDPQALLRVSQDGGHTFGNERRASIGRIGQYRKRVYWTRLGAPADCVVEVVWSDPSPVRVVNAFLNNAEKVA